MRDSLRQGAELIEAFRPTFPIDPRIALGERPQIAETSLFVHVQLNSYRVLKENKPKAMPSDAQFRTPLRSPPAQR